MRKEWAKHRRRRKRDRQRERKKRTGQTDNGMGWAPSQILDKLYAPDVISTISTYRKLRGTN